MQAEDLRTLVAEAVAAIVPTVIRTEMEHFLRDVEFRVAQAYDVERRALARTAPWGGLPSRADGKVYAEDMRLFQHMLTGYTVTNNSPSGGSIAWASVHIVYNGTDYTITDSNTALKYAWFAPGTSTTVMQTSNTKPTLAATDCLVFVNNAGVATVALGNSLPAALMDNAVDTGSMGSGVITTAKFAAGAVDSTALGSGAVIAGKIATGGVSAAAQFASGVVDSTALAAAAVTAGKIATGGVSAAGQFASGVVDSSALGANAVIAGKIATGGVSAAAQFASGVVDSTALAANSVVAGKIATGGVSAAGQFAAGVVDSSALGANAVTAGKIATGGVSASGQFAAGVVNAAALGAAAVTATKLNTLDHVLY